MGGSMARLGSSDCDVDPVSSVFAGGVGEGGGITESAVSLASLESSRGLC